MHPRPTLGGCTVVVRSTNRGLGLDDVMERHRDAGYLVLGGVSMIADDMITFIRNDLVTFGLGVLIFLVVMQVNNLMQLHRNFFPYQRILLFFQHTIIGEIHTLILVMKKNITREWLVVQGGIILNLWAT